MLTRLRATLALAADFVAGERTADNDRAGKVLGGTMQKDNIEPILALIRSTGARRILEVGPGWSTVHIASFLANDGDDTGARGHITALEHHEMWATRLDGRLRKRGLRDHVTLVVSPLVEQPENMRAGLDDPVQWYRDADAAKNTGPFDFVVIDGPPAFDGLPHRVCALPRMWDAIAPGAVITLDDAERPAEQIVLDAWRATFGDALVDDHEQSTERLAVLRKA